MKTLLDNHTGVFIRRPDHRAEQMTNQPDRRFFYAPKWMWKVQESKEYRGKCEDNLHKGR